MASHPHRARRPRRAAIGARRPTPTGMGLTGSAEGGVLDFGVLPGDQIHAAVGRGDRERQRSAGGEAVRRSERLGGCFQPISNARRRTVL